MDLPPPSVLTQLPRPLQASTGKTQIGEVFSLVESKKRKRYEVVVAVDGEGLNIYNVQYPKLVTSYAVPPQSEFSCHPCSIRLRDKDSSAVKRYTYCAVGRPQRQIKGFFEETVPGATSAPVITSASYTLKDSRSPVIFVGICPRLSGESGSKDPFDVLVVHKNGKIRRLASDLKTERWSIDSDHETSAAFLVDFDDARRTLFRRRPDLATLAVGDVSISANDLPPVLLLVSQPGSSQGSTLQPVKVHMFSVTTHVETAGTATAGSHELHHLNTVQLPSLEGTNFDWREAQWAFHPGSAGLGLSFRQGYMNYDLSQYPPSCSSSLILKDEDFSSIMRISPHSIIGAGKSLVALYDTHYSSIQRSIPLHELSTNSSKATMKFVGYFAKLGIALAIRENTLQAFDLSSIHSMRGTSVKRQRDGLLINAIGRGVGSPPLDINDPAVSLGLKTPEEVNQWTTFKKNLEAASKAQDATSFDNAVESHFGFSARWHSSPISVHPEKISYILSQIFTVQAQESRNGFSDLKVAIWPKKTCQWLVKTGHFSIDHIDIAVRRDNRAQILPPFEPGTLVRSLAEFDTSLKALTLVLNGPVPLERGELAQALKIFLDTARTHSIALDQPATMTITEVADLDIKVDDKSHDTDENPQAVISSSSSTETSLEDAFVGLNLALSKLHSYPTNQVVSCLRSTLSNTDTLAIVHHLRVALATGGYTARFTEEAPIPLEAIKAAPPLSLEAIVDLMNASVDAIGPSGWISAVEFAGAAVNEAEMISHMQSEISAALAGIEEAAYMKGIVGEFIRYGSRLTKSKSSSAAANKTTTSTVTMSGKEVNGEYTAIKDGSRARINREYDSYGKLWETYTFPQAGEEDGKMLPLSLNTPESEVSQTKILKSTGEVTQRTKREIAYLRRQAVPDYSVVRIHL
ncbi:hypothetical protein UA08_06619 [Talaromyces atroroseus]|uniref:Uncharacterized protein n=1 Tax=Talaromyces atroroseus TaxID=1441469 RepID=A0A225AFJ1_TALAT|nr:hypothetical protein UA08_06619 [Talaromyces atroroseus]OKL57893.1 hypothetical protein UA08_06619 [Talaromyces atroroseus]